ncbi:MAG: YggS family pyridoxal phosphate-dependent enzyme [Lachnospiraceae bacterium]
MLSENLQRVEEQVAQACLRAGRARDEVTLLAVSKTKPVEALQEIYNAGVRDFGENKVQEIRDKRPLLPEDIHWHMIGHLQRNKVKYIADSVTLIHSLDSLRLASSIDQEAAKANRIIPVLIEVNVAAEDSKFGLSPDDTVAFIESISELPHIKISGLMTIAPYVANPEDNRRIFHDLKKLSVDIIGKNINNISMDVLSMGMSGDYQVAIEEGATIVRVGTGIFGERDYSI